MATRRVGDPDDPSGVSQAAPESAIDGTSLPPNRSDQATGIDQAGGQKPDGQNPPSSEGDESNPRKLLKRARRQAEAGKGDELIETARRIASLLPPGSNRTKLSTRLDEAADAWAAGQQVDFDSLVDLIRSTIAPSTWDSVGGPGTVQPFPGGVYVNASGLLQPRADQQTAAELDRVRASARSPRAPGNIDRPPTLRKVSLPKLEREVARRIEAGQPLGDDIRYLAGLQQVNYLFVYPEEKDIVVAGPAEGWQSDPAGRPVGRQSGRPVMQLDDLVTVLRACFSDSDARGIFGCSIDPRPERLKDVQDFLTASAAAGPIEPSRRNHWLAQLRDHLGEQDIKVFGIPGGSRVAHAMVEADYRMKLIGIGLEPAAVPGIPSYFELLGTPDDATLARRVDTLRWWFTLAYDAIVGTAAGDAFEFRVSRVRVLSENEMLTLTGRRQHTGQSDPINAEFAKNFTEQFAALSARDPNFADLANIFDLSIVAALLRGHNLPGVIGWPMSCFRDTDEYIVLLQPAPQTVESVINHRVYRGRHITAAVSGGVLADPWKMIAADKLQPDSSGELARMLSGTKPLNLPPERWWWD
ncbi:MAG: DUF1598 domain-containing protein [Planctomycetes bacterium]|nr:DUF1598 domain-containing protein [Planctomycetota bacterium]